MVEEVLGVGGPVVGGDEDHGCFGDGEELVAEARLGVHVELSTVALP